MWACAWRSASPVPICRSHDSKSNTATRIHRQQFAFLVRYSHAQSTQGLICDVHRPSVLVKLVLVGNRLYDWCPMFYSATTMHAWFDWACELRLWPTCKGIFQRLLSQKIGQSPYSIYLENAIGKLFLTVSSWGCAIVIAVKELRRLAPAILTNEQLPIAEAIFIMKHYCHSLVRVKIFCPHPSNIDLRKESSIRK